MKTSQGITQTASKPRVTPKPNESDRAIRRYMILANPSSKLQTSVEPIGKTALAAGSPGNLWDVERVFISLQNVKAMARWGQAPILIKRLHRRRHLRLVRFLVYSVWWFR